MPANSLPSHVFAEHHEGAPGDAVLRTGSHDDGFATRLLPTRTMNKSLQSSIVAGSLLWVVLSASTPGSAHASVVLYDDHKAWTLDSGITQPIGSSSGSMLHAMQVSLPPAPGADLGARLDFRDCLPQVAEWSLTCIQPGATLIFADPGLRSASPDTLSIGAAGQFTHDDLRIEFPGTVSGGEAIFAFAFTIHDNHFAPGESIVVGGVGDRVLATFPLPHCPGDSAFVGIVAKSPIAWIRIEESDDEDDIAIGGFEIGSQLPPHIHYGLPEDHWYIHVGSHETLHIHAKDLALAEELHHVEPQPNQALGPTLTFDKSSPLSRAIRLSTLEGGAEWVFEDFGDRDHAEGAYEEALSVGRRGKHTHDSWQLEILHGPPVEGVAFMLGDSEDGAGECIEVYTIKGHLIEVITPMPAMKGAKTFVGLHAHDKDPIGRIVFHESPDSDDISISEIHLAPLGKTACPADFDHDGHVDGADLGALLAAWGTCKTDHCHEDLNLDGQVDAADLALLLEGFGHCDDHRHDG